MGARSSQSRGPGLNETDGHLLEYFRNTFSGGGGGNSGPNIPVPPSGLTATGGIINDYTSGSDVYRSHVFTSSGTFNVTAPGTLGDTLEYLVVAGGGSGGGISGANGGGGGGAGGLRTNLTGHPLAGVAYPVPAFPTSYTVTIGAGAHKNNNPTGNSSGVQGSNSEFYPTPVSYPSTAFIRSVGGGGGGYVPNADSDGFPGGSGGGGAATSNAGGTGNTPTDPNNPQPQGNPGGHGASNVSKGGGGGGGAGGAGETASGSFPGGIAGNGGLALQVLIAGPSTASSVGTPGPSGTGWYAGGGGAAGGDETFGATKKGVGGRGPDHSATTPYGGGGNGQPGGPPGEPAPNGLAGTGGGGGGGRVHAAGAGGSGIVVVRYKIAEITATAKASGGSVNFYGGKTIHVFTGSGYFDNTSGSPLAVEYIAIAGGGSGGTHASGAGGAGGVISNIPGFMPNTTTIPVVGPGSPERLTVTLGAGAASQVSISPAVNGYAGSPTAVYNTPGTISVTANAGGYGGGLSKVGGPGGSGGGGGHPTNYPGGASNPNSAPTIQGYAGGTGGSAGGGGGGGAGSVGQNCGSTGTASPPANNAGAGGLGVQLPTAYRDPKASYGFPGANPGGGYFAGGGGGGADALPDGNGLWARGGKGTVDSNSGVNHAGAGGGGGGSGSGFAAATGGEENSGSGGGGRGYYPYQPGTVSGAGGSGIVFIAYPS